MHKIFLSLFFIILSVSYSSTENATQNTSTKMSETEILYNEFDLQDSVDYTIFQSAIAGYNALDVKNKDVVTLIDFTKPSTEKRLFVLDMKNKKVLISSLVSHGRNSGDNYAVSFSNVNGSHKSSLGFYETENTYNGKNGYSLILNGLEKGINDKAKERAIVIHGADYCEPSVIKSSGRLGRSFGCPALPRAINKKVIDAIKGGTLLFIYAKDKSYVMKSPVLHRSLSSI